MANPDNHCREEEEKKKVSQLEPEEVQRQQRSGSSGAPYPNTTHTVEIQSAEDTHLESRANDGLVGAPANTPALTEQMNRIRPSNVQRRSSRVRFSLDAESRPLQQSSQVLRSSLNINDQLERDDGSSGKDISSLEHSRKSEKRDDGSYLRLRKSSMTIQRDAPATDQSSQALTSTKAPPAHLEPISPTSGDGAVNEILATKTRNRGYSLRRMIFNRNINRSEAEAISEPVELSPAQRSSHDFSQSTGTDTHLKRDVAVASAVRNSVRRQHVNPYTRNSRQSRGAAVFANNDSYIWKRAKQTYLFRESRRVFQAVQKLISRINEVPCSKDGRPIPLDVNGRKVLVDERTGKPYIGNGICSTRYSLWNFLPRQLIAQFSKLANL